jgi:8-oxo-dGTP pyrophosphatase MutT (NUDIX family)
MEVKQSGKFRTCGCIIECNGEFLFVHQVASGFWGFPKGTKHNDETTDDCAIRELREETSVDIKPGQLLQKFDWNKSRLYLVQLSEKPVVVVDGVEIDKFRWEKLDFLHNNSISKLTRTMMHKITSWKKIENCDRYRTIPI